MDPIRHSFPDDAREFAALEARLEVGDLSLSQLRDIEDQLVFTCEKTKQFATPLFKRLEERKSALWERQIVLADSIYDLSKEIARLGLLWNQLDPSEAEAQLDALSERVDLLPDALPLGVKRVADAARRQLEDLLFQSAFPIVQELDEEAMNPTFARNMQAVVRQLRDENSFALFHTLSAVQQREIRGLS